MAYIHTSVYILINHGLNIRPGYTFKKERDNGSGCSGNPVRLIHNALGQSDDDVRQFIPCLHFIFIGNTVQRDSPDFPRCNGAVKFDQGLRSGHIHLYCFIFAVVGICIKGEIRIIRPGNLWNHIHDYIGIRRNGKYDVIAVRYRHVVFKFFRHGVSDDKCTDIR